MRVKISGFFWAEWMGWPRQAGLDFCLHGAMQPVSQQTEPRRAQSRQIKSDFLFSIPSPPKSAWGWLPLRGPRWLDPGPRWPITAETQEPGSREVPRRSAPCGSARYGTHGRTSTRKACRLLRVEIFIIVSNKTNKYRFHNGGERT